MRNFDTTGAPHMPAKGSVRSVMGLVLAALLPGVMAQVWYFGAGLLIQIALAVAFALGFEAAMLKLRARPLRPFLTDLSAPLTAVLFALCLPPLAPWWLAAIGMAAAIVFAKHLFGGLGHNLFNPAMVGLAVVLLGFPGEFTQWLPPGGLGEDLALPGLADSLRAVFTGELPAPWHWDGIGQATPLDTLRTLSGEGATLAEILEARDCAGLAASDCAASGGHHVFGYFGGRGWEVVAGGYALGGLFLMWKRLIPWQVPVAMLGTVVLLTLPFWLRDPDLYPFPLQHVFSGALMLAAFFIATDPVTGCATPRGRLIFGAGVAVLTLAIRRWGAFPEGVAFAVLLMNCAAPWIDLHTRPRILGEGLRP